MLFINNIYFIKWLDQVLKIWLTMHIVRQDKFETFNIS
jgi:hypothetical protein